MKYYYAENARRAFKVGTELKAGSPPKPITIQFTPYDTHAGTLVGIYKTDIPTEIAHLDAIVAEKIGVFPITAEEHARLDQKKTTISQQFDLLKKASVPAGQALKGSGATVVDHAPIHVHAERERKIMETADEALKVGDDKPEKKGPLFGKLHK